MRLISMLAEATQTVGEQVTEMQKQINEIHEMLTAIPGGYRILWAVSIVTALVVITMFLRQKKIAQNQVDLAKVIKDMIEKKG